MLPELGNFSLMLALCVALVQAILPVVGAHQGRRGWMALARPAALAQCLLVSVAFGVLVHAFVANDFSVAYVAGNSNSRLPVYYRIAGAWGGHEGSLLLWIEMLSCWALAVALLSRQLAEDTVARVLGVLGMISVGFLAFLLFTSNPFDRLLPGAPEGRDLNPLLQDFGMIVHPPLLYMGYVGFSVAFAFAIAALLSGRLDAAWARWSRPWTSAAWTFLTLGIFMGSFWAYYELGWGGWWFWDPVENASFMPWLVGTALMHSLAVTEKRGSFKNWTVLLAIVAFSLSLLGTFLVRSGVLTSVHAFATDPRRGTYILVYLALVIGGSLSLYAWRAPKVGLGGRFELVSRESLLLVNNVLLLVASATVLLGTLYPLFMDAFGLGKISVGPPYFEAVFVPLMLPMLLLLAAGPFARWKRDTAGEIMRRLRVSAFIAVVAALAMLAVLAASPMAAAGIGMAAWIVASCVAHVVERARHAPRGMSWRRRLGREPASFWAMQLAHAGIGIFVVGVTMVNGFAIQKDVKMRPGDVVQLGEYRFSFAKLEDVAGPNYVAARGSFAVSRGDDAVTVLQPEKRVYLASRMPMTEAAIDRGLARDLYVSLGEAADDGAWIVRLQQKPFVSWIWAGCLVMALGGVLAAGDRRYRQAARKSAAAPANINLVNS
ncbi:heme lyase CcmF/NrfE family subunit [Noviherbaspirillum galbum]|uniref:Heme lyase CcmF/NrfE family subunit n=1 Tax=Noviherbaspirillum galbum TaxID=2709383 RepID=A0A6B3SLD1_9BURK|nr:heme lyase CcmF/NrfE family subunit [Noviherbaspirillum galbum]NEX61580.1 heme lyase CcmF/NrfE family subunit [Noviherbaspirillum galbum]